MNWPSSISTATVLSFLDELEKKRKNTIQTSAMPVCVGDPVVSSHHVAANDPTSLGIAQRVLSHSGSAKSHTEVTHHLRPTGSLTPS